MKRKLWSWLVLSVVAVAAVLPVYAQMTPRQMRDARDESGRPIPPPREEPVPREAAMPRPDGTPGRMSPAERRQLRRDIDDAGRELYRRRPPHPAP